MKKYIQQIVAPLLIIMAVAAPLAAPVPAGAIDLYKTCNEANKDTTVCKSNGDESNGLIKNVVNTLLYVLAAIAVIMIIVGGIRYATSGGDASGIKGGKDTILYAVIGLVVAMLAWAIVNFVVEMF